MAVVTIRSDIGAPQNKVSYYFHWFPIYLREVMGLDAMILVFWRSASWDDLSGLFHLA